MYNLRRASRLWPVFINSLHVCVHLQQCLMDSFLFILGHEIPLGFIVTPNLASYQRCIIDGLDGIWLKLIRYYLVRIVLYTQRCANATNILYTQRFWLKIRKSIISSLCYAHKRPSPFFLYIPTKNSLFNDKVWIYYRILVSKRVKSQKAGKMGPPINPATAYIINLLHFTQRCVYNIGNLGSGKYDSAAIPNLSTSPTLTTRGNDLRLQKNRARYDLRKFFLLIELSICGTVCLMTLCMQNLLIHLNPDWINSGLIRK